MHWYPCPPRQGRCTVVWTLFENVTSRVSNPAVRLICWHSCVFRLVMPFNVWFYVSTFLSPWARDVGQDSCWCHTCSTGHIYLEIGIYQLFIQFECLVHLWGYGHLALGVIVWEQSASSQIETRKLHGNVHSGFDSCNHLTFIVQSLHVFFPSMVCVIPERRPCGYHAL